MMRLSAMLFALLCMTAWTSHAAVFNQDPQASNQALKLGALRAPGLPADGTGTATLTGGTSPFFVVNERVWSTSGFSPGTSLFTGVPLISDLLLGVFCNNDKVGTGACTSAQSGDTIGPAFNAAVSMSTGGNVPNPVGPGNMTGLLGYGAGQGELKVVAGGGNAFTLDLQRMGAGNDLVNTLVLTGLATIKVTFGPWVTDNVIITAVTSNVIQMPTRPGTPSGVGFSLDPTPREEVKTFLNSTWTTANGFHPPFTFVTSWKDWTFAQTVSAMPGTHAANPLVPDTILSVMNTVTITVGGIDPTSLTSNTGTVTLVSPARVDTSDSLVNTLPSFGRMKFSIVPEPTTLLLLSLGALGLVAMGRRRMK